MDKGRKTKDRKKGKRVSLKLLTVLIYMLVFIAFIMVGIISYKQEKGRIIEEFQLSSQRIRDSIIDQIHKESFTRIMRAEDMQLDIYRELQLKLIAVRVATQCRYLYTAQALPDGSYIYVVDGLAADTVDFAPPGTPIEHELYEYMEQSLDGRSMLSDDFMNTDWGKVCTAYFPIYDDPDDVYGILCMEFDMEDSARYLVRYRVSFLFISLFASAFITLIVIMYAKAIRGERDKAEDTSVELEKRLDTLLSGTIGGLIICKDDDVFTYVHLSESVAAVQGYTADEMLRLTGGMALNNIHPDDRKLVSREMRKQYAVSNEYTIKYRVFHKDGSVMWVVENGRRFENEDGMLYHYCFCQNVTEMEHKNKLIIQERKQYRDALIANSVFFYSFDVTEGLVHEDFMNREGVRVSEALGIELPIHYDDLQKAWVRVMKLELINEKSRQYGTVDGIMKHFESGARVFEAEYYIGVRDCYIQVNGYMTKNEDDGHVLAVIIGYNVTAERRESERAKQALEEAYERANRANAAKSDFLSSMSHDIRTPMNAIIGMTAIAGTHLDDRDRVEDCLGKITIASKHLLGIINEVLDMSRIESGRLTLSNEEFSIPELIDNLLDMSKQQIDERGHTLTVITKNMDHEKVIGDPIRIQQMFMNLMSNAIKYTPEGGTITLELSEKPTNQTRMGCYEFVFEDNGIGMSEEYQKHLFEPFSRDDQVRQKQIQGTGLGLAITNNIVRMMGGEIKVKSTLGEGSRFTMTIFLRLQEEENFNYEEFIDLPVLVADDDSIACEMTCEILQDLGMKGEWVLSGRDAIERVVRHNDSQTPYFAVILDWKMPDLDGIATTREIRRLVGDDIPIIIISAYDWSDFEDEARKAGANAFIKKPVFKSRVAYLFKELVGLGGENVDKAMGTSEIVEDKYSGRRVLLVEDNELNAEIVIELLKMMGIAVEHAKNGREAVDLMTDAPDDFFDLVFMDIRMPVLNGYEAAKAIRALPRAYTANVPIIAMTANAFEEDIREAYNAGMNEHMAKPLDINKLLRVLDTWLGGK